MGLAVAIIFIVGFILWVTVDWKHMRIRGGDMPPDDGHGGGHSDGHGVSGSDAGDGGGDLGGGHH
jgi:hypothetical protein